MHRDPAKALQMLDLLEAFFGPKGQHWKSGDAHDDEGNRCLLSAMAHIRAVSGLRGDQTSYYLRIAQPQHFIKRIADFNDEGGEYEKIATLIVRARALASADLEKCSQKPKEQLAA